MYKLPKSEISGSSKRVYLHTQSRKELRLCEFRRQPLSFSYHFLESTSKSVLLHGERDVITNAIAVVMTTNFHSKAWCSLAEREPRKIDIPGGWIV